MQAEGHRHPAKERCWPVSGTKRGARYAVYDTKRGARYAVSDTKRGALLVGV